MAPQSESPVSERRKSQSKSSSKSKHSSSSSRRKSTDKRRSSRRSSLPRTVIAEDAQVEEQKEDVAPTRSKRSTKIPIESQALTNAINEIINSETTYLSMLQEFARKFIDQVRPIVNCEKGVACMESLMLSQFEFESMFGHRLESIIEHSKALVDELSTVSMRISGPMPGGGRPGLIAQAMKESAVGLAVYSPYVSSHPSSLQMLTKTTAAARESALKGRTRGASMSFFKSSRKGNHARDRSASNVKGSHGRDRSASNLKSNHSRNISTLTTGSRKSGRDSGSNVIQNFEQLWENEAEESTVLFGQSLQSLLILPVQRVPRHKMLLEQILKYMDKDHAAYALMEETTDVYRAAAKSINEALRKHEKIMSRFGDDENLRPTGATTTVDGTITNTYLH